MLPKLFWPTILLVEKYFEIRGWWLRICKIPKTIYSNSERSEQFLVTECFLTCSWIFLISTKLEQFKLEMVFCYQNCSNLLWEKRYTSILQRFCFQYPLISYSAVFHSSSVPWFYMHRIKPTGLKFANCTEVSGNILHIFWWDKVFFFIRWKMKKQL